MYIWALAQSCVPLIVGFLNTDGTREEWKNIWLFAIGLHCIGATVFGLFGTPEVQEWAKFIPEPEHEKVEELNIESDNKEKLQALVPEIEDEEEVVQLREIY